MTFLLLQNPKVDVLLLLLFPMQLASKYHKIAPYDLCALFQVIWQICVVNREILSTFTDHFPIPSSKHVISRTTVTWAWELNQYNLWTNPSDHFCEPLEPSDWKDLTRSWIGHHYFPCELWMSRCPVINSLNFSLFLTQSYCMSSEDFKM